MRPFIHLYFALLLPISLLIALLLIFYFTVEYNFTQSITLGILYGLFTGVFVTFIVVIAIVLLRKSQNNILAKFKITKKENKIDEEDEQPQTESSLEPKINENVKKGMDHKLMLLMNKELTFGIILTMIKKQISHSITKHNIDKGNINIKIHGEIISISITTLTKHTSQVTINGINNSKHIQDIVSFLKEKEHSFLQY
jgi:uncharacterized membrane protein